MTMMKTNDDNNNTDNGDLQKFCQEERNSSQTKIFPSCVISILAHRIYVRFILNTLCYWSVDSGRRICALREPGLPPVISQYEIQ